MVCSTPVLYQSFMEATLPMVVTVTGGHVGIIFLCHPPSISRLAQGPQQRNYMNDTDRVITPTNTVDWQNFYTAHSRLQLEN